MATILTYSVADFVAFTKIVSADMNTKLNDIKSRFNWAGGSDAATGLGDDNIQSITASGGGLTRATKLKLGTANHVLINSGTGAMSSEAQLAVSRGGLGLDFTASLAANAGNAIIVNAAGNALTLGSPIQSTLVESFTGVVSTLTAGETIAARAAVCLDLGVDASGNAIYRVFNTDYTNPNRRRSFLGLAQAAATVTAGVYTWVASANFVTSNSIAYTVNGRSYVTAFTSNNATTLQAVATQIALDPDVSGAVSDGVHTITVTGRGGLVIYISGSLVTGGASQPTITYNTTTPAAGQNVLIQVFGPLGGFTGLTTGGIYYVDSAGAITLTPSDTAPIQVGQAISDTVLMLNTNSFNYQFPSTGVFVKSHGSSGVTDAGGQQDVEHFNYITWAAGFSSSAGARTTGQIGDHHYAGMLHQVDGYNTAGSPTLLFQRYNKATWFTLTNRAVVGDRNCGIAFNNNLYVNRGSSVTPVDKWNGGTWSSTTLSSATGSTTGVFVQGGLIRFVAGSGLNTHMTLNSSDVQGTGTVTPTTGAVGAAGNTGNGGYYVDTTTTNSYIWAGSWSTALTVPYSPSATANFGGTSAHNVANARTILNGGSVGGVAVTTSATHNGVVWASTTASTSARSGTCAGVI